MSVVNTFVNETEYIHPGGTETTEKIKLRTIVLAP